jgi:colanic acid/amylovoran biosynthesis glycosyltransferase
MWEFLPLSETFTYRFIARQSACRHIVLTHSRLNESAFPYSDVFVLSKRPSGFLRAFSRGIRALGIDHAYPPSLALADWIFLERGIQVLHAHFGWTAAPAAQLARRWGIPLVVTFHGTDVTSWPDKPEFQLQYPAVFATSSVVTAPSYFLQQRLVEIGCPAEKIVVVRCGIPVDEFSFDPETRRLRDSDSLRFLVVARLVEVKGVEYTLQAFDRINHLYPKTSLTIVGDGPEKAILEGLTRRLDLNGSVKFLGQVPNSVIRQHMQESDAFVLSSITTADGKPDSAPVVLMEAQACGLPVISTAYSAIPEIVLDGESGFLVPEKDVAALANKMIQLVEHPTQRLGMGDRGRAHIQTDFNIQHEGKKLDGIYQELVWKRQHRS